MLQVPNEDVSNNEDLARKVLEYGDVMERTVERAKQPGFTEAGWDELAALMDTASFQRVGQTAQPLPVSRGRCADCPVEAVYLCRRAKELKVGRERA